MQALQTRKPNQIKSKQNNAKFRFPTHFLSLKSKSSAKTTNQEPQTPELRNETTENEKTKANQNSPYFFLFQLLSLRENPRLEKREPNPYRSRIEHLKTLELRNVRRSIRTGKREGQMRLWLVNQPSRTGTRAFRRRYLSSELIESSYYLLIKGVI